MRFNEALDSLQTYEAGKPIELVVAQYGIDSKDVIKLASNENPNGVAPAVKARVAQALDSMSLYPDDSMSALKSALSKYFGVATNELIIGSGSDQIIELAVHAKCKKNDCVLMAGVTFAMYEIYSKAVQAQIVRTKSAEHNLAEFRKLLAKSPQIIFLCTPNNPLGECLLADEIEAFLREVNRETLVVIDGAYQEYAAFKDKNRALCPKELIAKFPNVLYLGTFSKIYGLGGMRVGYGIAHASIIAALHKLRPPFNVTTLSLLAAQEALAQQEFVQDCLHQCAHEMARYENFCTQRGITFIPSYANFITMKLHDKNSTALADWLLQKGIIVRNLASYHLNAIRITIGTESQNTKLLGLLEDFWSLN